MSLLGIDIGTTGCKTVVFDKFGEILSFKYKEYPLIHPKKGWVELDAELIWKNIKDLLKEISQNIKNDKISAFSVSCQGEAVIPIDREGNSLYNAIVTFDSRTLKQYMFWKRKLGKKKIFKITGMPLNPMYSINKIMWVKDNLRDIFKRTHKFLCFEDFIFSKFGLEPTISHCLAARTMAFDVTKKDWSDLILKEAKINRGLLSEVKPSGIIISEIDSKIADELGLDNSVVGVTGGHDQGCGALGAGIINETTAMNAAGTSDVITPILNKVHLNDLMLENNYSCYPYVVKDKYMTITFNLSGGLLLKWYKDKFCYEEKMISENENRNIYDVIVKRISPNPVDVFILPHLVGSGTPYLDPNSKGIIIGLDLETDKSKISRAVLESTAYDLRLNLEKLRECGIKINKVIAIGGGAKSKQWLQIKADILGTKVVTLKNSEAASLGASLLAGVASGVYPSFENAIDNSVREDSEYTPQDDYGKMYDERYLIYKDIYRNNKKLLKRIKNLE